MSEIPTHPVQTHNQREKNKSGRLPMCVTLRAYEVYKNNHGEQKAMIEGWCRGGFSTGELIAFLYARTFPQSEWRARADEAFNGMENMP